MRPTKQMMANLTASERAALASTEYTIAYRIPGKTGFCEKTFPTEAARDRFIDKLLAKEGTDVEVRWAR